MPELALDDVTLAYDDSGETNLPPIVFLPGLSQSRSTWARITPAVAGTWRVLALDHRGHGDSGHAPGTYLLPRYGADTAAFLERVVGEPAVLVGHSLGGVIAAYVARTRPELVRSIFLEDPPLFRGEEMERSSQPGGVAAMFPLLRQVAREMRERKAPFAEYETIARAAPALNRKGSMADVLGDEGVVALARSLSTLDPEIFTPAIEGGAISAPELSLPLPCPVYMVRADPELGAAFTEPDEARFLATNPHATVEMFTGASHAVHDEQPDRFIAELLAFIGKT
jgi:pimeloyl-ACP methyl ester carboxylesterase